MATDNGHVVPEATAVAAGYHAHLCPNCCHRWVHPHRDYEDHQKDGLSFHEARVLIQVARKQSTREAHTCPSCKQGESWYWDNEKNRNLGASGCAANAPVVNEADRAMSEIMSLLGLFGGY